MHGLFLKERRWTLHKFIYCLQKKLSNVLSKTFVSTDSIPSNCELKFWQSSERPRCICNVVNRCGGRCGGHQGCAGCRAQPPLLPLVSEVLSSSTEASSRTFSISSAIVVFSVATMLLSEKTKSMSSGQRVTRSNPLADTTHNHVPRWQGQHLPNT